jgi:hypothetical protein
VCGSFWRVDKIQNGVAMETKLPHTTVNIPTMFHERNKKKI